ncbi:MAG TPA: hypothetical protein PK816_07490 [Candidatus Cloacimonadota bacterium]|nr:hypothetical protein [Candidatus Cloacimonadota bacterium]
MKGFWKKLLTVTALAGVSYVGFQGYKRVNSIVKLSKSLPDYLENIIEESPKVSITMKLNSMKISIGLSQEAYDKNYDLETHIKEYIEDFYPALAKLQAEINTYIKDNDDDDEVEESETDISSEDNE